MSLNAVCKRKKLSVPVFVVEDHNEVLYHVYRAIGSKRLPFENGVMLHFDSHPDLMIPQNFDITRIYDKEYLISSVSIESWIMPAVYAKHFSTIVWLKPPWASQLPDGEHHFEIGHHNLTKEIKVTCPQPYFVSELAWSRTEELEQSSDMTLEVRTLGNPSSADGKHSTEEGCHSDSLLSSPLCSRLQPRSYVLDIDLDFFSTKNPFLDLFNAEQFQMLSELYHYEHPADATDEEALLKATLKRQQQISELKSGLLLAKESSDNQNVPCNSQLKAFLATFAGAANCIDPELIHSAGCTCDDCALPHHVSSREEICNLVEVVKEFLLSMPEPAIITIARSSYDDYCPPEDVDFIQDLVLDMLKSLYEHVEIHLDYNCDVKDPTDQAAH